MVRNSFFKETIELIPNLKQKWYIKGPPRTLNAILQSLETFEVVSGQPWGYRSFSKEEDENRSLIGFKLQSRGKIKDFHVTARNYYKGLERLGFLFLDNEQKIRFTQAGTLMIKSDNPSIILFEQLVKYVSYDFHIKNMNLTFNPSSIFCKLVKIWYDKLNKTKINNIVYVSIEDLVSGVDISLLENVNEDSKFTYFRQFITWMENVSILHYNPKLGYTFLIQRSKAELFLKIVELISTEVISEFNNMESPTISKYFENYGTTKYTEKLQQFIITSKDIITQITGIKLKGNKFLTKDIEKIGIKPFKELLIKTSIQKEISRMETKGVNTKQIPLSRKSVLKGILNHKYVSKPERLGNDLWLSEINEIDISKLDEDILLLNEEINYASWKKPAVVTTWDFSNILIWMVWNLNRNPISENKLCLIPIKTMNLKELMKNINNSKEVIEILHYFGNLALRIPNCMHWFDIINEITTKLELLYDEESIASVHFKDQLEYIYMKSNKNVLPLMKNIYKKLEYLMCIERDIELLLEPITEEFKNYCFKIIMNLYMKLYENGMQLKEPMVVPDEGGDVGFHIRNNKIDLVILIENKTNNVIVSADDYSDKLLEFKSDENASIEVVYTWLVQYLA